MQDFYLNYIKIGKKYLLNTNLTKKMLQCIKEFDEEWMYIFLKEALNDINNKGDDAKLKYKELCEANGYLLYNAAMVYWGIKEIDNDMKNYDLYAKFFDKVSKRIIKKNKVSK